MVKERKKKEMQAEDGHNSSRMASASFFPFYGLTLAKAEFELSPILV